MNGVKRTLKVQARSDMVRERVRDAVHMIGYGSVDEGLRRFARRAEATSEREKLRFFKGDTIDPIDSAVSSLRNLLGMRDAATGRSEHWVLDLWEAVLSEIYHGLPARPTPDPAVDQVEAAEVGVQVFAETRSLPMRLLDAYTSRDDEAIMALALELEGKDES